jgi:hypothetical protein
MSMELVPGWRGYGARDFIVHPDSARREEQLAQLHAAHTDAEQLQAAVLPFRDSLPRGLRAQQRTPAGGPRNGAGDQGDHLVTMDAELLARECNADSGYRCLTIEILRCNPAEPRERPHWQAFPLEEADGMTLFIALNELRERQDPSLQFDFVCRAGICGSCGMLINGVRGLPAAP